MAVIQRFHLSSLGPFPVRRWKGPGRSLQGWAVARDLPLGSQDGLSYHLGTTL